MCHEVVSARACVPITFHWYGGPHPTCNCMSKCLWPSFLFLNVQIHHDMQIPGKIINEKYTCTCMCVIDLLILLLNTCTDWINVSVHLFNHFILTLTYMYMYNIHVLFTLIWHYFTVYMCMKYFCQSSVLQLAKSENIWWEGYKNEAKLDL